MLLGINFIIFVITKVICNKLLSGDSGYPNKNYLLTPFLNPATEAQQLFNESHIRTRNCIERCFGVVKRRFPVLAYGCRLKLETVLTLIISTCILHNIAIQEGEQEPPAPDNIDMYELNQLIQMGQIPDVPEYNVRNREIAGMEVRNNFVANYFANL